MEPSPSKSQSNALFNGPLIPPPTGMLRRQAHLRNAGESGGPLTPDPMKVKRIFPWEERPRHAPGRVFPDEDVPSTAFVLQPQTPVSASLDRKTGFVSPMPSPLFGFPPPLQSSHPPDTPPPPRYPSRVMRSMPFPSPLAPRSKTAQKSDPLLETESQDGDVEDEVDSEEEALARSRSRSSSFRKVKKYRSIGVQTDSTDLREESVQTTESGLEGLGPNLASSSGDSISRPIAMTTALPDAEPRGPKYSPSALDSPQALTLSELPDHPVTSTLLTGPEEVRVATSVEDSHISSTSSVTAFVDDASRSQGRKGTRVWDPSRGVEVFKRESEEVLARFLKMSSWESRS